MPANINFLKYGLKPRMTYEDALNDKFGIKNLTYPDISASVKARSQFYNPTGASFNSISADEIKTDEINAQLSEIKKIARTTGTNFKLLEDKFLLQKKRESHPTVFSMTYLDDKDEQLNETIAKYDIQIASEKIAKEKKQQKAAELLALNLRDAKLQDITAKLEEESQRQKEADANEDLPGSSSAAAASSSSYDFGHKFANMPTFKMSTKRDGTLFYSADEIKKARNYFGNLSNLRIEAGQYFNTPPISTDRDWPAILKYFAMEHAQRYVKK